MRYIYSNNLSSAMLELDDNGNIISYEEYHPFGTTAYQATNASINAVAKRYRYTGKERDEESGLYYHGARHYIPWLCRWTQCDPIGIKDGLNVYAYCSNNPVMLSDPKGTQAQGREEKPEGGNDKLVVPAIDTSTNSSGSTDLITPISTSQSYNYSGGGNQLTISTNLQTCATSIGLVANPATFSAFSSAIRADMAANPSAYATTIAIGAEEVALGDLISAALASAAASVEAGLGSLVEGLTMTLSAAAFLTISLVFIPNTANAPGSQHPPLAYSPEAIALPPGYLNLPPQTMARDNVGNPPVPPIAIPVDVAVPKEEMDSNIYLYRNMRSVGGKPEIGDQSLAQLGLRSSDVNGKGNDEIISPADMLGMSVTWTKAADAPFGGGSKETFKVKASDLLKYNLTFIPKLNDSTGGLIVPIIPTTVNAFRTSIHLSALSWNIHKK